MPSEDARSPPHLEEPKVIPTSRLGTSKQAGGSITTTGDSLAERVWRESVWEEYYRMSRSPSVTGSLPNLRAPSGSSYHVWWSYPKIPEVPKIRPIPS